MEKGKVTLSVIKADVGGYVGQSSMHQSLLDRAKEMLSVEEVMERLKSRFKS
jgi:fructose 1,6-bisphosphatase